MAADRSNAIGPGKPSVLGRLGRLVMGVAIAAMLAISGILILLVGGVWFLIAPLLPTPLQVGIVVENQTAEPLFFDWLSPLGGRRRRVEFRHEWKVQLHPGEFVILAGTNVDADRPAIALRYTPEPWTNWRIFTHTPEPGDQEKGCSFKLLIKPEGVEVQRVCEHP
jgi:hypothetical protein